MKIETAIECLKYCKTQLAIERGSDFSGVEALEMAIKAIERAPKKGRWIDRGYEDNWEGIVYKCSNCGGLMIDISNYCPNCGSYMKEDKE